MSSSMFNYMLRSSGNPLFSFEHKIDVPCFIEIMFKMVGDDNFKFSDLDNMVDEELLKRLNKIKLDDYPIRDDKMIKAFKSLFNLLTYWDVNYLRSYDDAIIRVMFLMSDCKNGYFRLVSSITVSLIIQSLMEERCNNREETITFLGYAFLNQFLWDDHSCIRIEASKLLVGLAELKTHLFYETVWPTIKDSVKEVVLSEYEYGRVILNYIKIIKILWQKLGTNDVTVLFEEYKMPLIELLQYDCCPFANAVFDLFLSLKVTEELKRYLDLNFVYILDNLFRGNKKTQHKAALLVKKFKFLVHKTDITFKPLVQLCLQSKFYDPIKFVDLFYEEIDIPWHRWLYTLSKIIQNEDSSDNCYRYIEAVVAFAAITCSSKYADEISKNRRLSKVDIKKNRVKYTKQFACGLNVIKKESEKFNNPSIDRLFMKLTSYIICIKRG